jgi:hypothetical protein
MKMAGNSRLGEAEEIDYFVNWSRASIEHQHDFHPCLV